MKLGTKILTYVAAGWLLLNPNNFNSENKPQQLSDLEQKVEEIVKKQERVIVIDKSDFLLYYYNNGKVEDKYTVAIGKNTSGKNKSKIGDNLTPEGIFKIQEKSKIDENYLGKYKTDLIRELEYSLFNIIRSPFGTRWMRLKSQSYKGFKTPDWKGIGIHGLRHSPKIFKYQTEGCVGLNVKDAQKLYNKVDIGDYVIIKP
ncbi:L,D-transpeptidase [Candidatus Woesearchaeota archaeon]|nr:L,D-transpeptidase [Candidatus Woesearchaeota archaeon]